MPGLKILLRWALLTPTLVLQRQGSKPVHFIQDGHFCVSITSTGKSYQELACKRRFLIFLINYYLWFNLFLYLFNFPNECFRTPKEHMSLKICFGQLKWGGGITRVGRLEGALWVPGPCAFLRRGNKATDELVQIHSRGSGQLSPASFSLYPTAYPVHFHEIFIF